MRTGYDFSLDWCSFPPAIILLLSRHQHTVLDSWSTFRWYFSNVHSLPLSIAKFFGDWMLQTHFVLMHACLERTTSFSLLINFIHPSSCISWFNIKPSFPDKYPRIISKETCIFMYNSCLNNCQKKQIRTSVIVLP